MIITCTECKKQFVVPDAAIPAEGRIVQCSSCSNEWKQMPVKPSSTVKKATSFATKKITSKTIKKKAKDKDPAPYSKEYMQQKWGSTVQNYAEEKGLSNKNKRIITNKKTKKPKTIKTAEKPSFGFFNYIITYSILFIFLVGILNFERGRISRKFPVLEPYIEHFFETLSNFKIFILDFYR